jgi:hypothetical protein
MPIPTLVHNLHDNWSVFLVDRTAKRWRPLGVLEGTAYATLDTSAQDLKLFLGHPVISGHPAVTLSLVQTGTQDWRLEIHNPTAVRIETCVAPSPFFDLLDWKGFRVILPPGHSTVLELYNRQTY